MRSILYIFEVNINERWIYYTRYESNDMNSWRTRIDWVCYSVKSVRLFHSFLSSSIRQYFVNRFSVQNLQSIRTRRLIRIRKAQIREVWNSIRSRNRYRLVAFASVRFWDIDRFIILICRYFRDQNSQQNSQQSSHSRDSIYFLSSHFFFCFRIYLFTSVASALRLSVRTMIRLIFESQSTNFFATSIDKRSDIFASKRSLKKTKR